MEAIRVERLDHLGLIASVINDLGLVSLIDARLKPDDQEALTPGEAVKGMHRNGLGFAHRPLSLSPQFFAHKPLELLLRPDVKAERLNRFQLGRTLEEVHTYGSDLLFSEPYVVSRGLHAPQTTPHRLVPLLVPGCGHLRHLCLDNAGRHAQALTIGERRRWVLPRVCASR